MDQLRHIGETLGGIKTLMLFESEIHVSNRQCRLLTELLSLAFHSVCSEIRAHLKFDERNSKWKTLENPLKELHRAFRECETYVKSCLESGKDGNNWWAKVIGTNLECGELLVCNLLWCVAVAVEAVESVGEISGCDEGEIARKRIVFAKKYEKEWLDPKFFQHRFGNIYLVSQEICKRMETAYKEDKWLISQTIEEKKTDQSKPITKHETKLADVILSPKGKIHPASVLLQEYQVRRRLGTAGTNTGPGTMKEAQWMGENFAVKHVMGQLDPLREEISLLSSLNHPNIIHYNYSFYDEEKKECYILMDLMTKDLASYIKEVCSSRRKTPFPLLVSVDIMLQIARGMEYLHSKKIYHGDLNPMNILVKSKSSSPDGYVQVKITGFGIPDSEKSENPNPNPNPFNIWHAPEVLSQENGTVTVTGTESYKRTEKGDVYSFSMICFELLTGKVPFEDHHLQGDKMSKNIRAGERPLFPFQSPKYLTTLTKKCWQTDPAQRPSFSSVCRILRYVKRFLVLNPDHNQLDSPVPPVEYCEIETSLLKRVASWQEKGKYMQAQEVPFQMYAYKVVERERMGLSFRERSSESGSEGQSYYGDENGFGGSNSVQDDTCSLMNGSVKSLPHTIYSIPETRKKITPKKGDAKKKIGLKLKGKPEKPPQLELVKKNLRMKSENQLQAAIFSPSTGRRRSGTASDSELH